MPCGKFNPEISEAFTVAPEGSVFAYRATAVVRNEQA
jgi:hypothetical protein